MSKVPQINSNFLFLFVLIKFISSVMSVSWKDISWLKVLPFHSSDTTSNRKGERRFLFFLFDNANVVFKPLSFDIIESQPNENAEQVEDMA